jgi:Bacteriophage probable baseplate hub protein
MITQVRTARPSLSLNGADYFSKLAPYFLSLSFADNCDGEKADDLQLHLADRDKRFIADWMPDKGTSIEVAIIAERWFSPNSVALKLDCGEFWIDTVDFELPQHTMSVKACSIPTSAHIKGTRAVRGWEDQTLKKIASQIAEENKMECVYPDGTYNPTYSFVEQTSESDLTFLKQRADDAALGIKVARRKVIFFDEAEYDKKEPSFTLVYGNAAPVGGLSCYRMSGAHFETKLVDTKKKANVAHVSPETGNLLKETATADDDELDEEQSENANENTDTADDNEEEPSLIRRADGLLSGFEGGTSGGAARKAKALLRDANKDKERAIIELSLGNPLIAAGQTFLLSGVGQFDGKWFLESAIHTVGPQYTTRLNARRCLEGY